MPRYSSCSRTAPRTPASPVISCSSRSRSTSPTSSPATPPSSGISSTARTGRSARRCSRASARACTSAATTPRWKTPVSTSVATSWSGSATRSKRREGQAGRGSVLPLPAAHPCALEDIPVPVRLRLHRLCAAAKPDHRQLPDDAGPGLHADADRLAGDGAAGGLHGPAVSRRGARPAPRGALDLRGDRARRLRVLHGDAPRADAAAGSGVVRGVARRAVAPRRFTGADIPGLIRSVRGLVHARQMAAGAGLAEHGSWPRRLAHSPAHRLAHDRLRLAPGARLARARAPCACRLHDFVATHVGVDAQPGRAGADRLLRVHELRVLPARELVFPLPAAGAALYGAREIGRAHV